MTEFNKLKALREQRLGLETAAEHLRMVESSLQTDIHKLEHQAHASRLAQGIIREKLAEVSLQIEQEITMQEAATNAVQEQQRPSLEKRPVEPTGKPDKLEPGKKITFAPDSKGADLSND